MNEMDTICRIIDGYRDEVIRLQRDLTSMPALGPDNGGSGEHEKAEYVGEMLRANNPDFFEELRAPDKRARHGFRPNILAKWSGLSSDESVWVLSHMDIVPPGDPTLWDGDPFEVRVDGDRLIGRGVEDNQHGLISSYLALKAVFESGNTPERNVGLAVVADEETGSEYGLQYLLKEHGENFSEDSLIIVPDGGNEDGTMIEIAEKSMLWLKFEVTGRQCHGSTPEKGRNSLFAAAKMILALDLLKKRFDRKDELFSPPCSTFEPTRIEANVPNINTIPGRDVFYMDCRILPCYNVSEIINECRIIADNIEKELDVRIGLEAVHRQDAVEPTPKDAPVVNALFDAIRNVAGKEAGPQGIGGGTVAAFFRRAGLSAAVWSTASDTAHQPNEFCLISNVLTDAKIFAHIYMGNDKK